MKDTANIDINLFMNMDAHVFWLDLQLKFAGCNDKVAEFWGLLNPCDIPGHTHKQLIERHNIIVDYQQFIKDDMEVINSGIPKLNINEPPVRTDKGQVYFYRTNLLPLKNKHNESIGVLGVSQRIHKPRLEGINHLHNMIQFEHRFDHLTKREKDILKYLVISYPIKHIALALNLSKRTVECHINSIKFKLGYRYKSELITAIFNEL